MKKVYLLIVLLCLAFAGFSQTVTPSVAGVAFGSELLGDTSASQSVVLSGNSLTIGGTLLITAPAGFIVSNTGVPGSFSSSFSTTYTGTSALVTVYIEFVPTSYSAYNVNLATTGGGLVSPSNVALSGNGDFACSGTPVVGTAAVSPTSGGATTTFTLTLSGLGTTDVAGIMFQWQQSSSATYGFSNIGLPSQFPTYSVPGISGATYWRCIATCTSSGASNTSNVVTAAPGVVASGCTPHSQDGTDGSETALPTVTFTGELGTGFTDPTPTAGSYMDQTGLSYRVTFAKGQTYTYTTGGSGGGTTIYIDFNNDGLFQASEQCGSGSAPSCTFSVSASAPVGTVRMRIIQDYDCCGGSGYPAGNLIPGCPTSIYYFESRDYVATIVGPHCVGYPAVGGTTSAVGGSIAAGACTPFSGVVIYTTSATTSGYQYQWFDSSSTTGGLWTLINNATNSTYTTPTISGPTYFSMHSTCFYNGDTTVNPAYLMNILTLPSAISASAVPVCSPNPTVLTATPSGGSWTSSAPGIATVGYGSGIVNGVSGGTIVATYALTDGCTSTLQLSVASQPSAISGAASVCQGLSTAALLDLTSGGSWSTSNTSIATIGTIGALTGIAYGVTPGNLTVAYTMPSGCRAVESFTVNPNPGAIAGTANVCVGATRDLTDPLLGGTWQSSSINATAGLTTGAITGVSAGPTTIKYTMPTGCSVTTPFTINSLPFAISYSVTDMCVGATTTLSDVGAGAWSSGNSSIATIDPVAGTVSGVTAGSTYMQFTLTGTGCNTTLPFTIDPLPSVSSVTASNGGYYCTGGSGVTIGLSMSYAGINYDLWSAGTDLTGPVGGTSSALDFGAFATTGTYSVVATNSITGCTANMSGFATVYPAQPLPNNYTVMGGGTVCTGSSSDIYIDTSDMGVSYQLYNGIIPVGVPVMGTGGVVDFGMQAALGIYTAYGTNTSSTCSNMMNSSVTITNSAVVDTYSVTGGGNYCLGGAGSDIQLANSDAGIEYQLWSGGVLDTTIIPVTGGALDFGNWTGLGSYTIEAIDPTSLCTMMMTGSVSIGNNPLPTVYSMTGGGNYCTGGDGLHVGLANSLVGTTYSLYMMGGSSPVATVIGSNSGLDFGLQSVIGTYTATATNNTTGCSTAMSGSETIGTSMLPSAYPVSSGSSYCEGGTGVVLTLGGSDGGVNYQLYLNGITPIGSAVSGTTIAFSSVTIPGTYTVEAINPLTTCTNMMTGSATVSIAPNPDIYNVTGGGAFCSGGTGSSISLNNTQAGVMYTVYGPGGFVSSPVTGLGGGMSLGNFPMPGTYTVQAMLGSCSENMNGSTNVTVSPLPGVYNVMGGGNYCAGGSGSDVSLSLTSSSITYQLYLDGLPIGAAVTGTGFTHDFGMKTTTGIYTVGAMNALTTCSVAMSGMATVGISSLPSAYTVTSPGNYCEGGSGVAVSLSLSDTTVKYKLIFDGTTTVSTLVGNGSGFNFPVVTTPGTYTAVGTDTVTGCSINMIGSTTIVLDVLPTPYSVTGGGNYCDGAMTGTAVSLSNSLSGIKYYLNYDGAAIDSVISTGGGFSFPSTLDTGMFTVSAVNIGTGCMNNMTGSTMIGINPIVVPSVVITTGHGDSSCNGSSVTLVANTTNGGSSPTYHWVIAGSTVSTTTGSYTYVPMSGDAVAVTVTSNANCATPLTAGNSQTLSVLPNETPSDSIASSLGSSICGGSTVTLSVPGVNYGGTSPVYAWIVDGYPVGSGTTYMYNPASGDVVFCTMTSNYPCLTSNSSISNSIVFSSRVPVKPVFMIAADPSTSISKGQSVIFSDDITAVGNNASIVWKVNGATVSDSAMFTSGSLVTGDTVSSTITSIDSCGDSATTHYVVMNVSTLGVTQLNSGNVDLNVIPNPNNGSFTVKGTINSEITGNVNIQVLNVLGEVVYSDVATVDAGKINKQVQMSNLTNGMYLLNIKDSNNNYVVHFVIAQ